MKLPLLLLLAAPCFASTVTRIRVINALSTSARIEVRSTGTSTGARARIIEVASGTCTAGTGGFVQTYGSASFPKNALTLNISALKPSTAYNVCPELLESAVWSTGASIEVTTVAVAASVATATPVDYTIPAANGSTYTVAAGHCTDVADGLQKRVNDAAALLPATGTIIKMEEKCAAVVLKMPGDVQTFATTDVRTSDSRVTLVGHGFSDMQEIRIDSSSCPPGTQLFMAGNNCNKAAGGWRRGQQLYANYVDDDHFQVVDSLGAVVAPGYVEAIFDATTNTILFDPNFYAINIAGGAYGWGTNGAATSIPADFVFQLKANAGSTLPPELSEDVSYCTKTSASGTTDTLKPVELGVWTGSCGSAIDLSTAGTGTFTIVEQGAGTLYVKPAPSLNGQYIHITSDSTTNVPPLGVRITSATTLSGGFQRATTGYSTASVTAEPLASNYVFEQLEWDTADAAPTAAGPKGYCAWWETAVGQMENVVVRQSRFKGPSPTGGNRLGCGWSLAPNGRNVAFDDNEFVNAHYYHFRRTGLVSSVESTTKLRLTAGSVYSGPAYFDTATTSAVADLDITGGTSAVTRSVPIYMTQAGVLTAILPTGLTATFGTTGVTTNVTTADTPTMPTDGDGCYTGILLATGVIVNGEFTTTADNSVFTNGSCNTSSEGSSLVIQGQGPGPLQWKNNYFDWSGLPLHFDDDGASNELRQDTSVLKNYFYQPDFTIVNTMASNGLDYQTRQPLESKGTERWNVDGNIFDGCSSNGTNANGVCIADTPRAGGLSKDHRITNNFVRRAQSFTSWCAPVDSYPSISMPCENVLVENNVTILDGYTYRNTADGRGRFVASTYAIGGLVQVRNNTNYDTRGNNPGFFLMSQNPVNDLTVENNVITRTAGGNVGYTLDNENVAGTNPGADRDYDMLILASTNGPGGTANYTWGGNIVVPSYGNSYADPPTTEVNRSSVCGVLDGAYDAMTGECNGSSMIAGFALGATVADRWAWLGYDDPTAFRFDLDPMSPLIGAGVGGADVGVDWQAAQRAQGTIRNIALAPGTVSIAVSFDAPDSKDVFVTVDDWATSTTISGAAGARMGTVSGLSPATMYTLKIGGYYDQTSALGFSSDQITTQNVTTDSVPLGVSFGGSLTIAGPVTIK